MTSMKKTIPGVLKQINLLVCTAFILFLLSVYVMAAEEQKTFTTPDEAVKALMVAVKTDNVNELQAIFGPEGKEVLSSGDAVADKRNREIFLVACEEKWWLERIQSKIRILHIGNEGWPFPIPLVKNKNVWQFDTAAGKQELLFRRIGRNELSTIRTCRVYVEAQMEYAGKSRDGKPAGIYAQKILSEPGKQDGLYWKAEDNEDPSPLGEFVANATDEGYSKEGKKQMPYHGYFYRILTAQGKKAPGGVKNYIVDGVMSGGFALVAYPAEYRNSGVMTFIINQSGIVYQKDLGQNSVKIAGEMKEYNPDKTWKKIK